MVENALPQTLSVLPSYFKLLCLSRCDIWNPSPFWSSWISAGHLAISSMMIVNESSRVVCHGDPEQPDSNIADQQFNAQAHLLKCFKTCLTQIWMHKTFLISEVLSICMLLALVIVLHVLQKPSTTSVGETRGSPSRLRLWTPSPGLIYNNGSRSYCFQHSWCLFCTYFLHSCWSWRPTCS